MRKTTNRLALFTVLTLGFGMVPMCPASYAATEKVLHSFAPYARGQYPSGLIADSSGTLYGTTSFGGDYSLGVVYEFIPTSSGGGTQTVLHSFGSGPDGGLPFDLIVDSGGNLYGETTSGGLGTCSGGCGTVFRLTQTTRGTWNRTTIYDVPAGFGLLTGALVFDSSGNLYGGTSDRVGGCSVFKLIPSSGGNWTETTLFAFSGGLSYSQVNGLALDSSGNLYGAVQDTGQFNQGFVFQLSPEGSSWTENTLYTFTGGVDGGNPVGSLLLHSGNLFGLTTQGGGNCALKSGCGVVFELVHSNGQWSEKVLYDLQANDNYFQYFPSLSTFDESGNLVGFTPSGQTGYGQVFELTPQSDGGWRETTLWNFTGFDGLNPAGLVLSPSGGLFGVDFSDGPTGGFIFELTPPVQPSGPWTNTKIYNFPLTDGSEPSSGLIADASGNLYGSTSYGGTYDSGSVFSLSRANDGSWRETTIYSFGPYTGVGYFTAGPSDLTIDQAGNIYGAATHGGVNREGLIFELSPKPGGGWLETDLVYFELPNGPFNPVGKIALDTAGHIYGAARQGGAYQNGAIFELTKNPSGSWDLQELHSFSGYPADGAIPEAGLTIDAKSNLFGTTTRGGNGDCVRQDKTLVGCGTVFELSHDGDSWIETVLHSFLGVGGKDGANPLATLVLDDSNNIYGTTAEGGIKGAHCFPYYTPPGCGTIFQLLRTAQGWKEKVLYAFTGDLDGSSPTGALLQDSAGSFYATARDNGAYRFGTFFKLSRDVSGQWSESVIWNFGKGFWRSHDGKYPSSTVTVDSLGNFYGIAPTGGYGQGTTGNGLGVIFEITP